MMVSNMVSRLERWAEDAERQGFSNEAAIITNQAKVFRKAGVPENFPVKDIKEIRAGLVRAMSTVLPERNRTREELLTELAKAINQHVGQQIADDIEIKYLVLPQQQLALSGTEFEGIKQVDKRVRDTYNRCVIPLARRAYSIGAIRNADLFDIAHERTMSIAMSNFVKIAFARPQHLEKQA